MREFVMKPERILLPLDIRSCPLEIFSLVEGVARRPEATLILLHVIHPHDAAMDRRAYKELALTARVHLERLARRYVHPIISTVLHVRLGQPAEQILEEAGAEEVELIILPAHEPSFLSRLVSVWIPGSSKVVSPLAQKIIRDSNCGVFVASVNTRFDCEREWGRPARKNNVAKDGSHNGHIDARMPGSPLRLTTPYRL
jgi:nucleotide-binding universal stress UspA family protein